ncbi:hypothetical protein AGABI1DRAFT_110575 [Agaricus bisporus var. burnettii JB137-S8]|uniref:Uncharacterized protein n=1 Tax=Agaricus bisporus var. burnettii (strain JB137-S8 / ATCC MYA-4627 / FGSC 10392) TaxID=597362 RepID=K5WAQ7_AGABU|nr:uncharacterized protein AGABI1DRAFT_110575 [Agaricus bisporus var. burnettii JB137-S8]EKM83974.1 hypothetical protein AGABI1DRAFT_110575 [Agaricus bisporus var. burnettii JB137-S8]
MASATPSNHSDNPTSTDPQPLIDYSRALHEYTLQRWLEALKAREEERNRLRLEQQRTMQRQPTQDTPARNKAPTRNDDYKDVEERDKTP